MVKALVAALVQFLAVFLIVGVLAYLVKGDFFYHMLSLIFGVIASLVSFITFQLIRYFIPKQDS